MNLVGILERTPWLIQRAHIHIPLVEASKTLTESVRFDYMGSSEFEFGALPQSLRRIQANLAIATIRKVANILDGESTLRVFSYLDDDKFSFYAAYLKHLREAPAYSVHLKERSEFGVAERMPYVPRKGGPKHMKNYVRQYADFWWDLDNDVMFSFNESYMNRLTEYLNTSFAYMDSKKA